MDGFDFDAETGKISNRATVVTIPEGDGFPDGMTIDADGMFGHEGADSSYDTSSQFTEGVFKTGNLWIAHWAGSRVTQWDPRSGKLLRTVAIPTHKVLQVGFCLERELRRRIIVTSTTQYNHAEKLGVRI